MGAAEILLVRHGATEWSATGRHTGRTDIPLSTDGELAARALRDRLPASPRLVLVSPRQRATETCRLAGLATDAHVDDDLREWDYGDYEGLTTPEIRARRPGWDMWRDGCPSGETATDVGQRADRVVERLAALDSGTAVVFAHGHLLRVLSYRHKTAPYWPWTPRRSRRSAGSASGALFVAGTVDFPYTRTVHWSVTT
jgi:broad specificity phosphatase PhoE